MRGTFILAVMLATAVLLAFLALMGTIAYRITAEALEIMVLGRVVRRIRLDDIEEVHRRGAFLHENWSGPKFWNSVIIRRKTGLLKNIVISPADPDHFVEELAESIRR